MVSNRRNALSQLLLLLTAIVVMLAVFYLSGYEKLPPFLQKEKMTGEEDRSAAAAAVHSVASRNLIIRKVKQFCRGLEMGLI